MKIKIWKIPFWCLYQNMCFICSHCDLRLCSESANSQVESSNIEKKIIVEMPKNSDVGELEFL